MFMTALTTLSAASAQHTRTGKIEYYWNNTWEWHYQLDHQFNAQGLEVEYTNHRVSVLDSSLSLMSITRKGYSGSGRILWRSTRSIDMLTQQLSIGDSAAMEYDTQDSLIFVTHYALAGGIWTPDTRNSFYRNTIGELDSVLVDTNASGTWDLAARMLVTLNTEGWISHIRYDSLVNNGWSPYAELAITYDTDGHPVLAETTDPTPTPYEGTRQSFTYDAQGDLDSLVISTKVPGGAWHDQTSAGYDPVGDGLSNSRVYYKLDTLSVDWTLSARTTYEPSTAIHERPMAMRLLAYPNPATDQVTLPALGEGVIVDLIAADGRIIHRKRTEAGGILDIRDLAPGRYVASIVTTTGSSAATTILKH